MNKVDIEHFLVEKLIEIGIEKEELADLQITTNELGLSSLELVDLSLSIEEKFDKSLRLIVQDHLKIIDIRDKILEE